MVRPQHPPKNHQCSAREPDGPGEQPSLPSTPKTRRCTGRERLSLARRKPPKKKKKTIPLNKLATVINKLINCCVRMVWLQCLLKNRQCSVAGVKARLFMVRPDTFSKVASALRLMLRHLLKTRQCSARARLTRGGAASGFDTFLKIASALRLM